jgi:hypothetical protein
MLGGEVYVVHGTAQFIPKSRYLKGVSDMARSKSISGSKANRTNVNQEQTSNVSLANVADVKAVAAEPAPADVKPEVRKRLEVVKTEPRRVVPINIEDEIRRRAYELYQQRGANSGGEAQDWLAAEREVRTRYHQQQSA